MQAGAFSRPPFGGHEKFVFRQGWLKKGLDAALEDPALFTQQDAFARLGVGKNMATSIRYWGLATGLLEDYTGDKGNARYVRPTKLGHALLGVQGWDPYLEDIGSLWLIHWQLASNSGRGVVWYLTFSRYFDVEFSKTRLIDFLERQFDHLGIQTTRAMIEREVEVFLRTYTPAQSHKGVNPEENLDCPLVDLNLLKLSDEMYRFDIGAKPSLPAAVFGYALSEYLHTKVTSRRTVTVDECVYQPGSPGQIFKLDENSVMAYLETLGALTNGNLQLQETAGLRQVYIREISEETGWELLRGYYG